MFYSQRLMVRLRNLVTIILLIAGTATSLFAQSNVEKFGQNRIQHRTFKWKYFDTKHFRIFHYDRSGRELARYVSEQVENDIAIIESKIGGQFPQRFNIILYNSYDEYKQTNVGRKFDSQLQDVPAGTVNMVGDKMVVYYTGVHTDLRRQTRSGMASVVMERMVFGETLRQVVRNAILTNLPEWTVTGFISYIVDGWDAKSNSDWKNLMDAYPNATFGRLAEVDPELAGKAFWKYISDTYSEGSMKNLVYSSLERSNINQAVKVSLGMKIKYAFDSTLAFYDDVYARDAKNQSLPDSANALIEIDVPKDGTIIKDIKVSPKGHDVAYVAWKDGEYKIHMQKTLKTQARSTIMTGGKLDYSAPPDPNYPIITWSNTGYKLAILYRAEGKNKLRIYNAIKAQIENYEIPDNRFDRVLGMTFMEDEDRFILSAIKKGKTDLYEFTLRGKRMKNITEDDWDDLQPWYVSGGSRRGILFLSNRPKANLEVPLEVNQLPTGPMNVFFYNTTTKQKELLRMTDVKTGDISQPIQYGTDNYAYLYNDNGINNQYIIKLKNNIDKKDSAYTIAVTNHATNIIAHQYSPVSNQVADVVQEGDKYKIYYKPLKIPADNSSLDLKPTLLKQSETTKKSVVGSTATGLPGAEQTEVQEEPILKKGNAFQTQFENEGKTPKEERKLAQTEEAADESMVDYEDDTDEVDSTYMNMRPKTYRRYFKPDFLSVKLDNSVLFTRYQPADLNGNTFSNPSLGGMVTASLDDLLEDYRFTGGLRIPINFSGMTYFFQFQNHRRRVDWDITYLRQTQLKNRVVTYVDTSSRPFAELQNEQLSKNVTDLVQGSASYPLNKFESIRMTLGLRKDALRFKAQDTLSLAYQLPDNRKYWVTSRAEYVFDNTINPTINIYNGFRFKFYGEYMLRMNGPGGGFYTLGTDFRYYKKIYKNFIWTARFVAAHSAGNQKVLYFVGGVDNWVSPKYSDNTRVRPGEEYAFQTLGTNMRGYEQNSWNGNTYSILSSEFRLPVLTTFMHRPVNSGVLRNLQLVVFGDVGSAWYGLWPKESAVRNDKIYPNPSTSSYFSSDIVVSVEDTKEIFGMGYGAGLRTMILGYFLRFDCAWNIDNHKKKPLAMFSIGTDF